MRYGFRQGLAPTKVATTLSYERGERERDQYLNFIWYNTLYSNTYEETKNEHTLFKFITQLGQAEAQ